MNQKDFTYVRVIVIAVVIVAGVAGYIFLQGNYVPITQTTPTSNKPSKQDISGIFQETGGCGNISVYQTNKDGDTGVSVRADKDALNLSHTPKTFRIEEMNINDLRVELRVGENVGYLYCNDALDPNQPEYKTLLSNVGEVTISISEIDESQPEWNRNYTTTVILKDIRFVEKNGNDSDMVIGQLIFKDVRVGWLPG